MANSPNDGSSHNKTYSLSQEMLTFTLRQLRDMWKTGALVDYCLTTMDGEEFHVHRSHIACMSDYLRTMLCAGMQESTGNRVTLEAVSSKGLAPILEYVYGGMLEITPKSVEDIVAAAGYLQMNSVLQCCFSYIKDTLRIDNCMKYVKLVDLYSLGTVSFPAGVKSISDHVADFLKAHFSDWLLLNEHQTLPVDTLLWLLQSNDLYCAELSLYNMLVDWLLADPAHTEHTANLMGFIRFALIPKPDLLLLLDAVPGRDDAVIIEMIHKALHFVSAPVTVKFVTSSSQAIVRGSPCIVALGGHLAVYGYTELLGHYGDSDKFHVLLGDDIHAQWLRFPELEQDCIGRSAASLRGFMFVCGGWESKGDPTPTYRATAKCQVFDPIGWCWSDIAEMNEARAEFSLVTHGGSLYALGGVGFRSVDGCDQHDPRLTTIEQFSLETNTWSLVGQLPCPASCLTSTSYQDDIFVYGEFDGEHFSERGRSLWSYNPQSLVWRDHPDHDLDEDGDCTLAVLNNHLCLVCPSLNVIMRYNPTTQQWQDTILPGNILQSTIVCMNDIIYCIGGEKKDNDSRHGACQSIKIDWEARMCPSVRLPDLPELLGGPCCAPLAIPYDRLEEAKLRFLRHPRLFPMLDTHGY